MLLINLFLYHYKIFNMYFLYFQMPKTNAQNQANYKACQKEKDDKAFKAKMAAEEKERRDARMANETPEQREQQRASPTSC